MFSWLARARGGRSLGILLVVAVFLLGIAAAPATAQSDKRVVKVMTYNADAGTDFYYFFAYPDDLGKAYAATVAELHDSEFEARAAALVDTIAAERPYLVALEEVTLWDYVANNGSRVELIADQLDLVKAAIKRKGLPYKVIAVQPLTDLALPLADNYIFHFLDQNVILARTDLSQAELALSDVRMAQFKATSEPLPGFPQVNGWISVDAKIRGKSLRFFATHLASLNPEDPEVQPAQGAELIEVMSRSPYPVVLAGDFNSDLSTLDAGPDQTPTAATILAAGYDDAWAAQHPVWQGLTWPMFWEDTGVYPVPPPDDQPVERIDLVFVKGLEVLSAAVVGTARPYPSDHAGVVATLLIEK